MLPYVVTIVVLIITSMRNKRENQPPASLGTGLLPRRTIRRFDVSPAGKSRRGIFVSSQICTKF